MLPLAPHSQYRRRPSNLVPTRLLAAQFKNLRGILLSPVPRIYDEGEHGPQPLESEARLLGANMDVEAIPRAAAEARARVNSEVMEPLNEWLQAYKVIQVRGGCDVLI